MLAGILIGRSKPLMNYVSQVCAEFPDICIYKTLDIEAPVGYELSRNLSAYAPDVIILEADPRLDLSRTVQEIYLHSPQTGVVAVSQNGASALADNLSVLGLCSPLVPPFSAEKLEDAIVAALETRVTGSGILLSFVPAKPGSGAAFIALNTAHRLRHEFGKKVLLIETDDYAGLVTSILGEAETVRPPVYGGRLPFDDYSWPRAVQEIGGIEVLSGRVSRSLTGHNRWAMQRLLWFVQSRYDVIVLVVTRLDEPKMNMVLARAKVVCLVASPDTSSIHFISKRCSELGKAGISEGKVALVVNRCPASLGTTEIEAAIGRKLSGSIPNGAQDSDPRVQGSDGISKHPLFEKAVLRLASTLTGFDLPRTNIKTRFSSLFKVG